MYKEATEKSKDVQRTSCLKDCIVPYHQVTNVCLSQMRFPEQCDVPYGE